MTLKNWKGVFKLNCSANGTWLLVGRKKHQQLRSLNFIFIFLAYFASFPIAVYANRLSLGSCKMNLKPNSTVDSI